MSISNSFLDYEIPSNFQYSIRQQTLTRKIYEVGKKLLTFLQRNQFAIAISLSSFLITKTIANHVENNSVISTAETTLNNCQDRICAYWKDTLQRQKGEGIEKANNSLSRIDFRCNTSHPNYKHFRSLNRCLRDWCKYAKGSAQNARECWNPTKEIVHLWNKFCPKSQFERLKKSQKINFLGKCLKKLCHHYKSHNETSNFYSLCMPLELHTSMEKLYKLVKDWKKADLKTKEESQSAESVLSMTSSSIGIISAAVSIVASGIGCYVAKVTMSSVSSALPSVSMGLRSIVDGTLAYARRASALPADLLSVPSMNTNARVSELSSHVDSLYYDAASVVSREEVGDTRQVNFNFGYQVEQEEVLAPNLVPELVEEKKLLYEEILPEGANFAPDLAAKVVDSLRIVTQKATTPFTSPIYNEVIDTTEKPISEFFEFKNREDDLIFPNDTNFFHNITTNITTKSMELLQIITQQFLYEETEAITSQKIFTHTPNVIAVTPSSYNTTVNTTVLSSLDIWRLMARSMNMG